MGKDANERKSRSGSGAGTANGAAPRGYRFGGDQKREDQRWSYVERLEDGIIGDAVDAVTAAGDALQFARSRDGGAYSITVYSGGARHVEWCNTPALAAEFLAGLIEDAKLMTGE